MLIALVAASGAFLGSLLGAYVAWIVARSSDRLRRREETMRLLRWATELAVEQNSTKAEVGLVVLGALLDSSMLDAEDVDMVATVTGWISRGHDPVRRTVIE